MIWVAVSALAVLVSVQFYALTTLLKGGEKLAEELEGERDQRLRWLEKLTDMNSDFALRVTEATELVEQLRVALTSLDDEYKDTTHAQGLWQAGIEERLSDLNLRVARNTAALDALPNAADIIAAVTGPFVELARPRPYQFQQPDVQTADVAPDAWDTYDPTDDEFPIRDPGDFTPPAAFGGLPGL